MALLISDSFSHYDHLDPTVKWPIIYDSTSLNISASHGRNGAGARISTGGSKTFTVAGTNNGTTGADCCCLEKYFNPGSATWHVGFAIKFADVELTDYLPVFSLLDTSIVGSWFGTYYASPVTLIIDGAQRLRLVQSNPYAEPTPNWLTDPSSPIKRNVYHYIEIAVGIGVSGSWALKIDGKLIESGTGDTQTVYAATANGVRFFFHKSRTNFGANVRTFHIDDIFINNDLPFSDVVVEMDLPNGDGDTIQWTPSTGVLNFANVDEASPNENTDYNTASAAGNTDVYTFTNLETAAGTVHGVVVQGDLFNNAFDLPTVAGAVKEGGATNVTAAQTVGTVTYKMNSYGFLTNPVSGNRFTISEVNADQFGLRRIS